MVSNEEFEQAYNNQDNRRIMTSAAYRFGKDLSVDTRKSCCLLALWRCLSSYNGKRKFTSSLYQFVRWECIREITNGQHKLKTYNVEYDSSFCENNNKIIIDDLFELLPKREQKILKERFLENRTLADIARRNGYSKEGVRQIIKKAILKLKTKSGV